MHYFQYVETSEFDAKYIKKLPGKYFSLHNHTITVAMYQFYCTHSFNTTSERP